MSRPRTPKSGSQQDLRAHEASSERRQYDSPLRQQQAQETRARIITAGAELVHGFPAWDWRGLTFRAVGKRAGVSERTVHRHFASERALRDAILQRLVIESGVPLDQLELANFAKITAGLFTYLSSFAAAPEPIDEPSFAAIDQHRRKALLDSVRRETPQWPKAEHDMIAAMLDMLWNVPSYERLVTTWKLDGPQATRAVTWVIGLIEKEIRAGRRPGRDS